MREAFTRHIYFPLNQLLKGQQVSKHLQRLQAHENLPLEELERLQEKLLRETLKIAVSTPFYRDLFEKIGFKVENIEALASLPLTGKIQVRQDPNSFVNPEFSGKVVYGRTSGSTGISLPLRYDAIWDQWNQSAQLRGRAWWKVFPGARELLIWGRPFNGKVDEWINNLKLSLWNRKLISAFKLGDENLKRILPKLLKFNPEVIYGYASAIGRFAEYLWDKFSENCPLRPRVIFYSTEVLFEPHRQTIKQVFGVDAVSEYGAAEAGVIAFQCPQGGLHISADRVLVEIVEPDEKGIGRVVITPLVNRAMSLIRYELGDLGRLVRKQCACGRSLPLMELAQARVTDLITTPGGKVTTSDFFDYIGKSLLPWGLRQFRVIQKGEAKLVIQMVQAQGKDEKIEQIIRKRVVDFLGQEMVVTFEYLKEILPEKTGKLRYYIRED